MQDTIDEISEELWQQILEAIDTKFLEFGVPVEREELFRDALATKIITKLENDLIVES
jgi:hypothetical protein